MNKAYILKTLKDVFNGQPWYGLAITELLKRVDPTTINQKTGKASSIAEILEHTLSWHIFTIEMMKGNLDFDIEINSETDWKNNTYNPKDYQNLVTKFNHTQTELLALIEAKTGENWLLEQVPNRTYDFTFLLNGTIQHDIYHIGQIVLLTKMYG